MDVNTAREIIREWRKEHRHSTTSVDINKAPLGFMTSAMSDTYVSGEEEVEDTD